VRSSIREVIGGLWRTPSAGKLLLVTLALVAADWGNQLAGSSFWPGAPLDECAHLLTTALVFWAAGTETRERLLLPALAACVMIDLDHVPDRIGIGVLTAGTPRPYTHSLLTIALLLGGTLAWHRRRDLLLGVAAGLAIHFWRDLGEHDSGVSLLWPLTNRAFRTPHVAYVMVMALIVSVVALRAISTSYRRGKGAPEPAGLPATAVRSAARRATAGAVPPFLLGNRPRDRRRSRAAQPT
jgi:inner membrane protein